MNPKFFQKAFMDIQKQKPSTSQHPPKAVTVTATAARVSPSPSPDKKTKPEPLNKRISKAPRPSNDVQDKKWKHDKYEARKSGPQDPARDRTLLIEDSPGSSKLIGLLKGHKINIEEISDYRIVFSSVERMEECEAILKKEGVKCCRKPKEEPKKGGIFDRLS